jgi:cell division protein FtsL
MSRNGWFLAVSLLLFLSLVLGLAQVWCNIERMDLAYEIGEIGRKIEQTRELNAKLEVERDNLLSPYRLTDKARELGLRPPGGGEIRELAPPG